MVLDSAIQDDCKYSTYKLHVSLSLQSTFCWAYLSHDEYTNWNKRAKESAKVYELERSRASLQSEREIRSLWILKLPFRKLISLSKENSLRKLLIVGFSSCGIPYASTHFSAILQWTLSRTFWWFPSAKKPAKKTPALQLTCSPSFVVKKTAGRRTNGCN